MRKRSRRHGGVHVVEVPHAALVADVTAELAAAGLSLDDFIRLGSEERIEDPVLRGLWLMTGPALTASDAVTSR